MTPNVDIRRQMRDPDLGELGREASIVVADGEPVVLASRLQGTPLPERVTGSSLVRTLSQAALDNGLRLFLIGGSSDETGARAARALLASSPTSTEDLISHHCPPFGFENNAEQLVALRSSMEKHDPHIVFIGLGFPKQDLLARDLREHFPHAWFVGCGAGLAMLAGEVGRAPAVWQHFGMEWMYRLLLEPRRLFRRYVVHDIPFAFVLLRGALLRRFARR